MTLRNYLTRSEVENLLACASRDSYHPERNHCMLLMAFIHGLRASELLSLKMSDIDIGGRTLYIRRLKNGFSTIQPLLQIEVSGLCRWLEVRNTLTKREETDYLFTSRNGHPLSRQQFYNIIKKAGEMAGLPLVVHPHMLRHACGYALADAGVDTRLIQDYLGHRNIRHTVLYTASNPARFEGMWKKLQTKCKGTFSTKVLTTHSVCHKCTFF
ncbi:tyrosine-type recombinase/integrase [Salmonella enterica]|uniref:Tyrosine-type recombinase/integrase n=1 Tax=Salmonella enterica TaxID=28901 RepID=A0A5Y5TB97_SALER|nr:DNA recombinase [Salmonella enterica]EBR9009489.1 DNA recombinase [Salmonella enterica subsp. enterica serovar Richmond]EBU7739054.1 DNA recombinase [Salmonella enterica subsp. enterica serovar Bareilly]EBX4402641.1 DNA recombinase [Salmonella enterica subsp. enterica serovar Typhimurium]ECA4489732.1 DNA recombinase [Salmonella enterica subsp. enterica serovar Weltevreden]ECG6737040.1 DNA recombinase [Salmonella enterica subsp. enterica serovar Lexington]EDS7316168.1 tyrosine-type recombin